MAWQAIIKPILKKLLMDEIFHQLGLGRAGDSERPYGSGGASFGTGGKVALYPDDPRDLASITFALARAVSGDVFNLMDADPRLLQTTEQLRDYVHSRASHHLQHWNVLFGRQGILGELTDLPIFTHADTGFADILSDPLIDFAPGLTDIAERLDRDGSGVVDSGDIVHFQQSEERADTPNDDPIDDPLDLNYEGGGTL